MVVGEFDLSVGVAAWRPPTASFIATSTLDGQAQTPDRCSGRWSSASPSGSVAACSTGCSSPTSVSLPSSPRSAWPRCSPASPITASMVSLCSASSSTTSLTSPAATCSACRTRSGSRWRSPAPWLLLDRTTLGRKMYAVGGNAHAAYLSGINAKRIRLAAFATAGFAASVGGVLQAATTATANTSAPQPWMLQSIAGVFWAWRCSGRGDQTCRAPCSAWSCCARQRSQLHRPQRLPSERHFRGGDRACGTAPGAGTVANGSMIVSPLHPSTTEKSGNDETTERLESGVDGGGNPRHYGARRNLDQRRVGSAEHVGRAWDRGRRRHGARPRRFLDLSHRTAARQCRR